MKLTQRRIETLHCPAGKKDILVFDDEQTGLGIRVTAGGGKSYLAQYRHVGGKRRLPLGSCSAISLAAARNAARAIMGDVAKGLDPASDRKRKAAHDALTLEALVGQWETLNLAGKRERYAREAVRALRYAFAGQLKTPAAELSRSAVVRVIDRLTNDGKAAMASRTAAYGRACYQWAVKRGSLSINPFHTLPLAAVIKRDRVLTDDELLAIWRGTERPGSFHAIVRMLILTGQRREEVAGMTWGDVAADLSTWIIPAAKAKNGVAQLVPLSSQAQGVLRATAAPHGVGSRFVFPGLSGPFNGFSKAKAALDKASDVKDWRLHDIRRSVATNLQRLGIRLEVTEAILNHISGSRAGIVGVYQRHHWAHEKRAALAAWGAHVASLVEGGKVQGSVTPIRAFATATN
jgi:integrase